MAPNDQLSHASADRLGYCFASVVSSRRLVHLAVRTVPRLCTTDSSQVARPKGSIRGPRRCALTYAALAVLISAAADRSEQLQEESALTDGCAYGRAKIVGAREPRHAAVTSGHRVEPQEGPHIALLSRAPEIALSLLQSSISFETRRTISRRATEAYRQIERVNSDITNTTKR
jgi:hypothetical protein